MKYMKKFFVTLLLAGVALSAMAADLPKQGFGLQIGWAQPILRLNSKDNPSDAKDSLTNIVRMNGFKVGVVYDGSFVKGFGTSIGLNYTFGMSNGGWKSMYPNNVYPKSRQLITYQELEVFVDWQYKFEIAKETYLMLYTGPTMQCGLAFSMRQDKRDENPYTGETTTTIGQRYSAYTTDKHNEALKRLNVTWGVGAGFQYKRYFIRGGYDFGLINPYKYSQFEDNAGNPMDHYTRGRLDQWNVKVGIYLWYE